MVKPLDVGLEERLLKARLEYVRNLQQAFADDKSLIRLSVQVYSSIIDELIEEIATDVKLSVDSGLDDISHKHNVQVQKGVPPPVRQVKAAQAEDAFGTPINSLPIHPVACPSCDRRVAASRFANHLDKCLHRSSR